MTNLRQPIEPFRQRNSTLNKVFEPFSAVIPARLTWPDATCEGILRRTQRQRRDDVGGDKRVIKDGEQIAPYHVMYNDVY